LKHEIGGGQVGCEIALHLARIGKDVTVIEMPDGLAPDATVTHRTELLQKLDAEKLLNTLTGSRCTAVTETGIVYADKTGKKRTVAAGNVILATGMRAKKQEAEAFRASAGRFVSIGDCVCAATVEYAIRSAFYAAVQI
jgi:flavanone/flavanol-cleaving reductase